jgi:hypothetical protein
VLAAGRINPVIEPLRLLPVSTIAAPAMRSAISDKPVV